MVTRFLGFLALLALIPSMAAAAPGPSAQPTQVEAVIVKGEALERTIEAVGTLISNESAIISPEISGRVTEILFDEGQEVKQGDILLKLDDSIYKAELAQMQSSLALSRANYSRAQTLFKQQTGTGRARDETLAKLNSDLAGVDLAKAQLDKTLIKAPFDGLIGLRQISIGNYVTPGQALVNFESIDPLKVDFRVAEIYLDALAPGQKINVRVDSFPAKTFEGEVYAIDPKIDNAGRTVVLRARLPNTERQLRPGLFARVNLVISTKDNAILIPEQSLMPQGQEQFLYKIVDGKAVMTKVKTGQRQKGHVEITEGVKVGDQVITAGQMKLRPDGAVSVVEPVSSKGQPQPAATQK
jgi:membrane fusion protein (multidrug efflux system)